MTQKKPRKGLPDLPKLLKRSWEDGYREGWEDAMRKVDKVIGRVEEKWAPGDLEA